MLMVLKRNSVFAVLAAWLVVVACGSKNDDDNDCSDCSGSSGAPDAKGGNAGSGVGGSLIESGGTAGVEVGGSAGDGATAGTGGATAGAATGGAGGSLAGEAGSDASGGAMDGGAGDAAAGAGGSDSAPLTDATIDFEDLDSGTVVTTQYDGVTFSSEPGVDSLVLRYADYCGTSGAMALCVGEAFDCTEPKILTFSPPASGLKLLIGCTDTSEKIADVHVFQDDTETTLDLLGRGNPQTPAELDLSSFSGITRLEIRDTGVDAEGFTLDDITFQH